MKKNVKVLMGINATFIKINKDDETEMQEAPE